MFAGLNAELQASGTDLDVAFDILSRMQWVCTNALKAISALPETVAE
jgi:hypothetical protein